MNKKLPAFFLFLLIVVGSCVTFYGLNLLFSDMANMFMSKVTIDLVSSLPGFILSLDFILATMYVIRYVRRPQYKKRMTSLYLIILSVFSALGIGACIATWLLVYGSLFAPYPFPYYTIIALGIHGFLFLFSIVANIISHKKMAEDPEKRKKRFGYVLYTIFLAIFICFAYYRLGAILMSPLFIQVRTLYLTWPFYAAMLVPTVLLLHTILYAFGVYTKHPAGGIVHAALCFVATLGLDAAVILIGMKNTQFISAISPVLPLERLASLPIDTLAFTALTVGYGLFELIYSIRYAARHKKAEPAEQ